MLKLLKDCKSVSRNQNGLTMVEIMMTLLIFATVLAVVNNVFFTTQKLYGSTSQRAGQQMNTRAGLGVLVMELRAAAMDPSGTGVGQIVTADATQFRVQSDYNNDGNITTAEPSEDVTYTYNGTELQRNPGTGNQDMIPDVTNFAFTYFDANGVVLGPTPLTSANRDLIRSVGVIVRSTTVDGGDYDITTRIKLRNMEFN